MNRRTIIKSAVGALAGLVAAPLMAVALPTGTVVKADRRKRTDFYTFTFLADEYQGSMYGKPFMGGTVTAVHCEQSTPLDKWIVTLTVKS